MQEALRIAQEEEDRLRREEEEKQRLLEEIENARLEKLRKEQEKKEKKKAKEKARKEKLKAEGKLLTAKQKQAQARAQAMLEAMKAQGIEMPEAGENRARPGNIHFFFFLLTLTFKSFQSSIDLKLYLCKKVQKLMFLLGAAPAAGLVEESREQLCCSLETFKMPQYRHCTITICKKYYFFHLLIILIF